MKWPEAVMEETLGALIAEVRSLRKSVEEMLKGQGRPLLLNQKRVALELSLSQHTVARLIARGDLATVRPPGCRRVLVSMSEVERWALANAKAPAAPKRKRTTPKSEAEKIRALVKT